MSQMEKTSPAQGVRPDDGPKVTEIWEKYQKGIEHHRAVDLYGITEQCHWMYEGDQWHGLKSGGEEFPVMNFIKPVTKYKVANVAMNSTAIVFSAVGGAQGTVAQVCELLNEFVAAEWDHLNLESCKWAMVKGAAIEGDYYAYLFDATPRSESVKQARRRLGMRMIQRTNVYLEDEQNRNLNEQGYIIIAERSTVQRVREEARRNGISEELVLQIVADEADDTRINTGPEEEVKTEHGKCTVLLYMELTPEGLKFCRSAKSVIYQTEQLVGGMDVYPLTGMIWEEKSGSARGIGCVEPMIPNQLTVNKNLARRALMVKRFSFPAVAYDPDRIDNPDELGKAGAKLKVRSLDRNPLQSLVQYLTPPNMNGDAQVLQTELMERTRELEGASSEATGQVDPTKTSGEAIKAARDQSAMSLTDQAAAYKQWVEDLARVMYKLFVCYQPEEGVAVQMPEQQTDIMTGQSREVMVARQMARSELLDMDINIRIDVSNTDPYSLLSREIALENALTQGHITFEEYVEAMDAEAGVPKDKFEEILRRRAEQAEAQAVMQQMQNAMLPGMGIPQQMPAMPGGMGGMA